MGGKTSVSPVISQALDRIRQVWVQCSVQELKDLKPDLFRLLKGNVTLLCHCAEDAKECHRFLLQDLIERE